MCTAAGCAPLVYKIFPEEFYFCPKYVNDFSLSNLERCMCAWIDFTAQVVWWYCAFADLRGARWRQPDVCKAIENLASAHCRAQKHWLYYLRLLSMRNHHFAKTLFLPGLRLFTSPSPTHDQSALSLHFQESFCWFLSLDHRHKCLHDWNRSRKL